MSTEKFTKRTVGGSAAERGLDFQGRISAIVMAHLLAERRIGWLEGVLDDTPLELDAETGGPGDDIGFVSRGGKQVELQAKRGLQRGSHLWDALLALALGISAGRINAGVLAVCPNSSATIRVTLAEDIVRLGNGRSDGLREIGLDWAERLSAASLDASLVCGRLRIVVVSAVEGNRDAEASATERLSRIIHDPQSVWPVLVECGRRLIRVRGRATPEDIYRDLSLASIALKTNDIGTRVQLLAAIREWLHRIYASTTVLGVRDSVSFEACWLDLDVQVLNEGLVVNEELDKALRRYHEYGRDRRYSGQSFQSRTIARFVKKCVVVGGAGIGKSTLLKRLALDYSADGYLTLLVRLPLVVALVTREGRRFEDSLLDVALSASGIRPPLTSLEGAVLLCDALDECGNQQPLVTAALHAFSEAHPRTRIVVTSRPIGYRAGELSGWRHYELQPLSDTDAEQAVLRVLEAIPFANEALRSRAVAVAKDQLRAQTIKGAASRSPLMITLLAALSAKGIDPGSGKASLYRQLFLLLEDNPSPRLSERPPSEPERGRFLELLGWCLLCHANEAAEQTLSRCALWWSEETGQPYLISESRVSACLEYWEVLGIVERVRTLTQEAITFVHKTFGEFAAGRYMSKCDIAAQQELVVRSIRTPEWKESLSFASHLGLAPLILKIWAELAERGDTKASYRFDDAIELVVQAGVPVTADALALFAQCCWQAVENTASRARYAAGEALCLMSLEHWNVVREAALVRLQCSDPWDRLVAWTCWIVSPDQELMVSALTDALRSLQRAQPPDSHLGGLHLRPTGSAVRQHLVLGAASRVLAGTPEPEALQALKDLIGDAKQLNIGTIKKLQTLFKRAGLALTTMLDPQWSRNMVSLPTLSDWNREIAYLFELVDDPSIEHGKDEYGDGARSLELAALLTATSFWEMPISNVLQMSASSSPSRSKSLVIHAVARAAGLDYARIVRQARAMKQQILDNEEHEESVLSALPQVDAEADFNQPHVSEECMPELEELILSGNEFFARNSAMLLYGLREQPEYSSTIERLLTRGRGESLRFSAALASELPYGVCQQLLLDRVCHGDSTPGCRYVYQRLEPPYGFRHIEAIRKGLEGFSANAATAAAEMAAKLPVDDAIVSEWRTHFNQWKTKEKPYPKGGGAVPDSPRDELVKILVQAFAYDHVFLLELLADDRPNVRSAAREPFLTAAAASQPLRTRLIEDVLSGSLEPSIFSAAVSAGLYQREEAMVVARLLHSSDAHIRYAALPILDSKFLPTEIVRSESAKLLTDTAMDIREGASRALRGLGELCTSQAHEGLL